MSSLRVKPSSLCGVIHVPPSKSHTLRALVFALMAHGSTEIHNFLASPDTDAMIQAVTQLGARVERKENVVHVQGTSGNLIPPKEPIDAGNSGLVLRLIGALSGLLSTATVLTGDASITTRRPLQPLLDGLNQLGASCVSLQGSGYAPARIQGPIKAGHVSISGVDSQPVSALLIATSFLEGETQVFVTNPGEKPWIDLTLSWLDRLKISYRRNGYAHYTLSGKARLAGFSYAVPADFSSAAYPIAAALIAGGEIRVQNLDFSDAQGDKAFIEMLQNLGAKIEMTKNELIVKKSVIRGGKLDVNSTIDMLPLWASLGCFAQDPIEVVGGAIARKKESDRISAIIQELKKMGAHIEERPDGFIVFPSKLRGAKLFSHQDHRIALSLAVAALGADGASEIEQADCTRKTYPNFVEQFRALGAHLE